MDAGEGASAGAGKPAAPLRAEGDCYELRVAKDDFKFNAAHFVAHADVSTARRRHWLRREAAPLATVRSRGLTILYRVAARSAAQLWPRVRVDVYAATPDWRGVQGARERLHGHGYKASVRSAPVGAARCVQCRRAVHCCQHQPEIRSLTRKPASSLGSVACVPCGVPGHCSPVRLFACSPVLATCAASHPSVAPRRRRLRHRLRGPQEGRWSRCAEQRGQFNRGMLTL